MHEDLEAVASLRIGQTIEHASREHQVRLSEAIKDLAARGMAGGGQMTQVRFNLARELSEKICRGIYETWLDLIQKRHRRLTRPDIDFINAKVEDCAATQARNITQAIRPTPNPNPEWIKNQAESAASSIASNIRRELEIKFREQEAFPPPDVSFWAFILAFREDWTTKMSGPLTVPFTAAALYFPGYVKALFALLAVSSGVYSSYQLWKRARLGATSA
jgi:hypothetical protein